jgi:hypothetical protein
MFRPSHVAVSALLLMVAACNDDTTSNVVRSVATVRLVNDTDTPLSIAKGGVLDSANKRLVFGQASTCLSVDLSNTSVPVLTLTNAVTGTSINFTAPLTAGANLMLVAFGDTLGPVQLTTLTNTFVPAPNAAGLRFFNGVPNAGSLIMQRGGITLTEFVGVGFASSFVSVPTDSARVTFSNVVSVVLDAGLMAFPLGQSSTVVLGPPARGTNPLRFFTVQGC